VVDYQYYFGLLPVDAITGLLFDSSLLGLQVVAGFYRFMGLGGGCRFVAGCCNFRLLYVSWFLGLHKVTCLLQVVADFADLLPVVAGGVWAKWLIISVFLACCRWLQLPVCCLTHVF